ncbi:amino acid permease [Rickettsiales endosymbiont of Peranema trichophorum]|uniref:APC family permease n=1 Tax=Rickettsiales endosymbiont of Peranema trichophorum TaxID=2486577 RepID=UPI001022E4F8|nr:amino acid permease [Rickettsiales endosymbiont of Peranema trichophorum]RZI45088.1 amino acid permease [Rickettsiales endosymbiont of Peranema trichophorum]
MSYKRFFHKKLPTEIFQETSNTKEFVRTLGPFQLVLLGIGAIIGAGVFVVSGPAASQYAGPSITLSFALAGIACAFAGLCYAELGAAIPLSGGAYTYVYVALGEVVAWFCIAMILLCYIVSVAIVAAGWSGYMVSFLGDYGIHISPKYAHYTGYVVETPGQESVTSIINIPALFIVMLLTAVVYRGTQTSSFVNAAIVAVKVSVLFGFIAIGATYIDVGNWVPFIPENTGHFGKFGWSGIVGGASVILLAFNGFDTVATAAQETKNPQRDLPIGILGSLALCTLIYVSLSAVLTGVVNYQELDVAEPLAIAVNKMQMPWFATAIKIGAISGLTSVILVYIYATVRTLYAVTQDGLLPQFLGKCNPVTHTPTRLTVMVGSLIAFFASAMDLEHLVTLSNFGTLMTLISVCISVICLRYQYPELPRPFKCPVFPFIPILGVVLFSLIMTTLPIQTFIYASIWICFMMFVYFAYGQFHSVAQKGLRDSKSK